MLKATIHIDINTYEFVEMVVEAETEVELMEKIKDTQRAYHKLCIPEEDNINGEAQIASQSSF